MLEPATMARGCECGGERERVVAEGIAVVGLRALLATMMISVEMVAVAVTMGCMIDASVCESCVCEREREDNSNLTMCRCSTKKATSTLQLHFLENLFFFLESFEETIV